MAKKEKEHRFKNLSTIIISVISCTSLGLIFTLMDVLSYGRNYLIKTTGNNNSENISMIMHLYSTITAQISYGIFNKVKGGLMAGGIVENYIYSRKIHENCLNILSDENAVLTNTLFCFFLGTLLFSLWSFLLKKYNAASFLKYIPKAPLTGVLGAVGLAQFIIGYEEITGNQEFQWKIEKFIIIGIIVGIIGFLLEKRFYYIVYIIPLYLLTLVCSFYLIFYLILGKSIQQLVTDGWLNEKVYANLYPGTLYGSIFPSTLSFRAIFGNLSNIISMSLFCLIFLPINLPAFCMKSNLKYNFNDELMTQSIGNLLTSLFFTPTYLICSYSIFFNKSGGKSKIMTIFTGVSLISLVFLGPALKPYLPKIVLGTIPFIIGISLCWSAFYDNYFITSKIEYINILGTALISYYCGSIQGIVVGSVFSIIIFIKDYIKELEFKDKNVFKREEELNAIFGDFFEVNKIEVINVDYILFFATLSKFIGRIQRVKNGNNVVIDLSLCYSIDWLSNDVFLDSIRDLSVRVQNLFIVTNIENSKLLKNIDELPSNIHTCCEYKKLRKSLEESISQSFA